MFAYPHFGYFESCRIQWWKLFFVRMSFLKLLPQWKFGHGHISLLIYYESYPITHRLYGILTWRYGHGQSLIGEVTYLRVGKNFYFFENSVGRCLFWPGRMFSGFWNTKWAEIDVLKFQSAIFNATNFKKYWIFYWSSTFLKV